MFTAGILRQAELTIKHGVPVYLYEFSHSSITRYNIENTLIVHGKWITNIEFSILRKKK